MKPNYISLNQASSIIQKGGIVAIPTETVYGLAGSIFKESALNKIFYIKKRPFFNPLIVHCANKTQINTLHTVTHNILNKMIDYFSPGPLTFILNKNKNVNPIITAGQNKVGLRIPKHPLTLKLIQTTGALCAPSANLFSQLSPTRATHVDQIFKGRVPILNGGECTGGIESTVLEPDFINHTLTILRAGLVSKKKLQLWLKKENYIQWTVLNSSSSLSPGQLKKHYQPRVPLILIETQKHQSPSPQKITNHLNSLFPKKIIKQLKLKSSPVLSARVLYHQLNILSQNSKHIIYIIKTNPLKPSWEAIWDRLNKASYKTIPWNF